MAKAVVVAFKPTLQTCEITIRSRGAGYLGNNMGEDARAKLRARGEKGLRTKAEMATPEDAFMASRRFLAPGRDGGTDGIPAAAFAKAIVNAGYRFADYKSTKLRGSFFIITEDDGLVPIVGPEPEMREDMARNRNSIGAPAILVYRAWYREWSAKLTFEFNSQVLSIEELVPLVELAGFHVGVGARRPENDEGSNFGRFTTAT